MQSINDNLLLSFPVFEDLGNLQAGVQCIVIKQWIMTLIVMCGRQKGFTAYMGNENQTT